MKSSSRNKKGSGTLTSMLRNLKREKEFQFTSKKERDEKIQSWITQYHLDMTLSNIERLILRSKIVKGVFCLLPFILRKKRVNPQLYDDCLQNMVITVLRAIENYDPNKNVKFASYLSKYLVNGIIKAIRGNYVVPYRSRCRSLKSKRKETLAQVLDDDGATGLFNTTILIYNLHDHFFDFLYGHSIFINNLKDYYAIKKPDTSPDIPNQNIAKNSDDKSEKLPMPTVNDIDNRDPKIMQYLEDINYDAISDFFKEENLEDIIYHTELKSHFISGVLSPEHPLLSDKEKLVIKSLFGVDADLKTLGQIADLFKLHGWNATKEWICQLKTRALVKLRSYLDYEGLTGNCFPFPASPITRLERS